MYRIASHLWRTRDGRLVPTGHPDAQTLAYAAGDHITDDLAVREGLKAMERPRDKSMPKPADKSGLSELQRLRERASELGVVVDGRWSAARLRQEIATKEDSQ